MLSSGGSVGIGTDKLTQITAAAAAVKPLLLLRNWRKKL